MDYLKSLEEHVKKCLDNKTPSPIKANSIMGEGHQRLRKLDAAYSNTEADLKHHIEEVDGAQANHPSLRMEQQVATKGARAFEKKARAFEEKARAAWTRQRELLSKETKLLKHMQFCRGNVKTLEIRLKQLEVSARLRA
jgi:hypothetical protein